MRTILTTCGTSILKKSNQEKPLERISNREISAETNSLHHLNCDKNDTIILATSDSISGQEASTLLKKEIENRFNSQVIIEIVYGLEVHDEKQFVQIGLDNLFLLLKKYYGYANFCINATGGYKGIVSLVTLFASVYRVPVYYQYEDAGLIRYPVLPVTYDMDFFSLHSEIIDRLAHDFIPLLQLKSYSEELLNLCYIENDEAILSTLGHLLYERFLEDFPLDIVQTKLSVSEKKVGIRDDHGQDILLEYANRIIKHPFVEEVRSSEWEPKVKNMIGKIDVPWVKLILTRYDRGYTLSIKTTGVNEEQVKQIASILVKKYL